MNKIHIKFRILFLGICCTSIIGCAQSKNEIVPKSYIAYKTTEVLQIDGEGNEEPWKNVAWSDPFIDIEGVRQPKFDTRVKMLWDEKNLYILAKMEEPHVWANLKQHDTIIFYNNDFEVFIDPDGDTHNYYELEINALNTTWDLFVTKPYRELNEPVLNDWHVTGLRSAVKVDGTINNPNDTDKGWTVEMAIPWSVYKTSYFHKNVPVDQFWRVNFSRVNWDHQIKKGKYERKKDTNGKFLHEYNWVWSPQGVVNMHEPEKWGYVYFSSKEVGKTDSFSIPQDEKIKWELYKLYRAQKKYYQEHKSWSSSLKNLGFSEFIIDQKQLFPELENHSFGWNITVKSPFSNKLLIIKEDGKFISK